MVDEAEWHGDNGEAVVRGQIVLQWGAGQERSWFQGHVCGLSISPLRGVEGPANTLHKGT